MQCNYNSFIQIINFHGLFRNVPRCQKTGACRILVPLQYPGCLKGDVLADNPPPPQKKKCSPLEGTRWQAKGGCLNTPKLPPPPPPPPPPPGTSTFIHLPEEEKKRNTNCMGNRLAFKICFWFLFNRIITINFIFIISTFYYTPSYHCIPTCTYGSWTINVHNIIHHTYNPHISSIDNMILWHQYRIAWFTVNKLTPCIVCQITVIVIECTLSVNRNLSLLQNDTHY